MKETRELMWFELMKYYGMKEIPGSLHNATILSWWKRLGYDYIEDDETAWCSLTINIMALECGIEHTGKLDARSWMKIGKPVSDPSIGHVAVFYRGTRSGWQGHVGLFAGYDKTKEKVITLGGNQNNMITLWPYPVNGSEFGLLGFRELNFAA